MVLGPVFRPIIENCWQQKFGFLQNMSFAFFLQKLSSSILQVSVLSQGTRPLAHPLLFKDISCSRRQHALLLRN